MVGDKAGGAGRLVGAEKEQWQGGVNESHLRSHNLGHSPTSTPLKSTRCRGVTTHQAAHTMLPHIHPGALQLLALSV